MAVMVKRSVYDGGDIGSTGAESHLVVLGMIPPHRVKTVVANDNFAQGRALAA